MRVAVVGAGIAGLTAALALARTGHDVAVLERAEPIEPIGAGIQVSPNAHKVLRALGLHRALNAHSSAPREIAIRDGLNGALLTRVPLGAAIERRHGAPYLTVHRGDLQAVLLDAARHAPRLAVRTGAAVVGATADGRITHASTAGSLAAVAGGAAPGSGGVATGEPSRERFDLIVGADGVRSAVRAAVRDDAADETGATAWRALVPSEALPRALAGPHTGLWLGPNAHLVHYPVRSGTETNLVAVTPRGEAVGDAFAGWHADPRALLNAAPEWRPWPTRQLDPARPWSRGRVVLIGDAAHAMWPYAAQGGAMAIEDGWTLAAALRNGTGALAAWEAARRARVSSIARLAARNRRIYHGSGPVRLARNLAMRATSAAALMRAMDAVYSWSPPAMRSSP